MTVLTIRISSLRKGSACAGPPIDCAMVLLAYSNGTYSTGQTNEAGECAFDLYRLDDEMTLLAAAKGHMASHLPRVPATYLVSKCGAVEMEPAGGQLNSILFTKSTGHIPGITGRLNPINDGRCYVYADNIAVNGKLAHPARFDMGDWLDLIDVKGMKTTLRFLEITGQFSLIEFTTPEPYGVDDDQRK